jgi:hypothetical protein
MTGRAMALVALAGVTLVAVTLSGGALAAAATPVLAVALLWAAWRAPLRVSVLGLMFLSLIADAPADNPMDGLWRSPFYDLGQLLCNNWSKTFAVPALSFSGIDLLSALLVARIALGRSHGPLVPDALKKILLAFLGAIAVLAVLGATRSGEAGIIYWQVRQLVFIPVFVFLLAYGLAGEHDYRLLGPLILAAALVKTATGAFFYFAIARPQGLQPACVTSHSDTMLFCLSLALVGMRWMEQPDARSLRRCLWFIPVVMLAVWLNNRRIAYVGLAAVLAVVWSMSRWNAAKRAMAIGALTLAPLLAGYVALGWSSDAVLFKPVASIRTIITPKGTSSAVESTRARKIENFNLSRTLRMHPLGLGLGHPYEEVKKGPDISHLFPLYRYLPHNSVLFMMMAGGPLGFFFLWGPFVVGMYLAARAHRFARNPLERVAALAAFCAQLLFLIQAYGDIGTRNWSTTWLVAAAMAVSGKLALANGAWPSRVAAPELVCTLQT